MCSLLLKQENPSLSLPSSTDGYGGPSSLRNLKVTVGYLPILVFTVFANGILGIAGNIAKAVLGVLYATNLNCLDWQYGRKEKDMQQPTPVEILKRDVHELVYCI